MAVRRHRAIARRWLLIRFGAVQDLGLSDLFRSTSRGGKVGRVLIEVLLGGSAILVTEVCLATGYASAEADRELLTDVAAGQAAASTASNRRGHRHASPSVRKTCRCASASPQAKRL